MADPSAPKSGEVITNIPTEMALRQAEIQAMRTLSESVNRLTDRMDHFAEDLGEIKSKVTTIEARNFDHQIAKLENDTEKAIQILHDSNKLRDGRIEADKAAMMARIETDKTASNTRMGAMETQLAKFGGYVAVAGAVGGSALGVIATKVFGG